LSPGPRYSPLVAQTTEGSLLVHMAVGGLLSRARVAVSTIGFPVVETSSRRGLVTWAPVFEPGRADHGREPFSAHGCPGVAFARKGCCLYNRISCCRNEQSEGSCHLGPGIRTCRADREREPFSARGCRRVAFARKGCGQYNRISCCRNEQSEGSCHLGPGIRPWPRRPRKGFAFVCKGCHPYSRISCCRNEQSEGSCHLSHGIRPGRAVHGMVFEYAWDSFNAQGAPPTQKVLFLRLETSSRRGLVT
jgi:hypothetical protein